MALLFVDETETEGLIDDDFSIEYDGAEDVEGYVDRLLQRTTSYEDATEEIIIDMVNDLDIREVRRRE